jgi:hypothetical protein
MTAPLSVCLDESPLSKISGLIPARCVQTQEKRTAAFWSFMLREIKRAVLRDCEVHIWIPQGSSFRKVSTIGR